MTESTQGYGTLFLGVWLIAVLSVIGAASATAFDRRRRGEPVLRPRFPTAVFEEAWCSIGRRPFVTANCVWVALLPDRLITGLHFPFQLLAPRRIVESMELEVHVPIVDIVSSERLDARGHTGLRIGYRTTAGVRYVELWVRDRERLARLLHAPR
jgi:hypothetical protein